MDRATTRAVRSLRLLSTSPAVTASSSSKKSGVAVSKELGFIPAKMKEEILELYEADDKRWTATTLATRFGVPRENVAGLMKLGELRRARLERIEKMSPEQRKIVEELRMKSVDAWNSLPSPAPKTRRRISSPRINANSVTMFDIGSIKEEIRVVQAESQSETNQPADVQKSPWAEYIENNYDQLELDAARRTSFAFIEVAGKGGMRKGGDKIGRAVWIRDGKTGKIRLADTEEKRLLLDEVKARDSKAFLTTN